MKKELVIIISGFIGLVLASSPQLVFAGGLSKSSANISHPACNLVSPRVESAEKRPEGYIPFLAKTGGGTSKKRVLFCVEITEKTPSGHSQTAVTFSVPAENVKFIESETSIMPMITSTFDDKPQGENSWFKDRVSAEDQNDIRRGVLIRLSEKDFKIYNESW